MSSRAQGGGQLPGGQNQDLSVLTKSTFSKELQEFFKSLGLEADGDNETATMLHRLAAGSFGNAISRQGFNNSLEGDFQSNFRKLIQAFTEDPNALSKRASEDIFSKTARGQRQAGAAGQGLGSGGLQGVLNAMGLDASRQASAADQKYRDPERNRENLSGILQAITQSQSTNPGMNNILQAFGPVETRYNQHASEMSSQGIGGILGSALGMGVNALSGGFGVRPRAPSGGNRGGVISPTGWGSGGGGF